MVNGGSVSGTEMELNMQCELYHYGTLSFIVSLLNYIISAETRPHTLNHVSQMSFELFDLG